MKPADVCIAVLVAVTTALGGIAIMPLSKRSQVSKKQVLPKIA